LCVDCHIRPAAVYDHRFYARPLEVDAVCYPCNMNRGPAYDRDLLEAETALEWTTVIEEDGERKPINDDRKTQYSTHSN
jgi:hypothetical protein